jgi:head-tail adaptor
MARKAARTGRLRERITIQTRNDTESGDSASDVTYTTVDKVNADVINIVGREQVDGRGQNFTADYRIEIRWYSGLTKKNMLLYRDPFSGDDLRLEIVSLQNVDERRRRMWVFANIEAPDGDDQNPSAVSTDVPLFPA